MLEEIRHTAAVLQHTEVVVMTATATVHTAVKSGQGEATARDKCVGVCVRFLLVSLEDLYQLSGRLYDIFHQPVCMWTKRGVFYL